MTPIFSRNWLVNRQIVSVRLSEPASLRRAFDLGLGCESRHRVDSHDIERARTDEELGDLERLLACVGLGNKELVDVYADPLGVGGIHRVLGVDEGADSAPTLSLGDHVVDKRRLARSLGPEDLDDTSPRQAADPECEV
jgi:hypothetical protein